MALGVLYLALAYLSISLGRTETALLWPASGLYLGVLLASDRALWPHLAVGVLAGSLGANLLAGSSPAVSLAFAVPSCAEGLLGAVLVLRLAGGRFTLGRTRDVAALVAGGAIVANALTALSAAAAAVQAFDATFGDSWLRWWSADALGIVAIAPIVFVSMTGRLGRPTRRQIDQGAVSVALLVLMVLLFPMAHPAEVAAVVAGAVAFPMLAWVGWRWSIRTVAILTPAVAAVVIYIATQGAEAFGPGSLSSADLVILQAFLAVLVVASLSLGVAAGERRDTEGALRRRDEERDQARSELSDALELLERREKLLMEADAKVKEGLEELNRVNERIQRLGDELGHKAGQLERAGHEHSRLQAELERSEGSREEALQRLAEAREATAAREAELVALQDELAAAHAERDTGARALEEAAREQEHLHSALEAIEQKLAAAERQWEDVRREFDELGREHSRTREQLEDAQAEAGAARATQERLAEVDAERLLLARRGTELIARYDARGICLYASPACRELVGRDPEELVGTQGAELLHRDDLPLLNRARAADGDSTFHARLRRSDGGLTEVEATFVPIRDPETGQLLEIEASVRRLSATPRIDAPAALPAELRPLTDRDPLTGLFVRSRFEEELRGQLAAAGRYGIQGAVLAVDLDRFRELNGLLGHSCTDDLLRGVGHAFGHRLRGTDVLGRTGDDQFALILPRASGSQSADVAGVLLETIREVGRAELGTGPLRLTASIGIAQFGEGRGVKAEELLVEAEIAVQDAKQAGGDSFAIYDGTGDGPVASGEPLGWSEHIRAALREDRLVLHAQPIVSLSGDPFVRHELLPQMVGLGGETVPPAAFVPAAARLGLAEDLDRWLLQRAAAVLAREQRAGNDPRLEVALCAEAPPDAELGAFVAEELRACGANPRGLCVAIKETSALRGGGTAGLALRRLADLGCDVGLDAFGTGLASFLHVEGLPVAYLKLDEGLVRRLGDSQGAALMVRSIASMATSLGLRTVARSVPDAETLSLLRRLGVGYAQGPAVAEPRPLTDLRLSRSPGVLSV